MVLKKLIRSKIFLILAISVIIKLTAVLTMNSVTKQASYNYTASQVVDLFFQSAIAGDFNQMVFVSVDPCIESNRERIQMFRDSYLPTDPITAYTIINTTTINSETEEYTIRISTKSGTIPGDLPYRIIRINNEWKLLYERFSINGILNSPDYGKVSRMTGCEARTRVMGTIIQKIKAFF